MYRRPGSMFVPATKLVYDMPWCHGRDGSEIEQFRLLLGELNPDVAVTVLTTNGNGAVKIQDFATGLVGWLG